MPSPPTPSLTVKTIDFSPFLAPTSPDTKIATALDILESFKTIGFVSLTNHGLPQARVNEMFDWSKKFFALPMQTKNLAPHPAEGTHHRGYSAPGRELVSQDVYSKDVLDALRAISQDYKETFDTGREDDSVQPPIWLPEEVLPGFRKACVEFYWTCYELEKDILRALALGLGLSEEYFIPFHSKADGQLRLSHYPATRIPEGSANLSRISAHTDFDTITVRIAPFVDGLIGEVDDLSQLLFQDDVGGLEVEDPQNPGYFIPIVPVPNAVVVNAGDFLARWSNDIIKSTMHRVRAPPNASVDGVVPERYSIPYFCACDLDLIIDALPGTWSEENPKKYEPTSVMEYAMKRFATAY